MIFNQKKIKKLLNDLYPINRSITGKGYRISLEIIKKIIPFKILTFKTGEKIYDWQIPLEWNIDEAFILTPNGKKIADFKKHNLHVVNYSIPVKKKLTFRELKKH